MISPTKNQTDKEEFKHSQLESFAKRFGKAHLDLACHAAFPLALTPELLYCLRENFPPKVKDRAPWIAVNDILLFLCDPVGFELYEFQPEVRQELLVSLKQNFGEKRLRELSDFMVTYIRQKLNTNYRADEDLGAAPHWTALAYVEPKEAVNDIAKALKEALEKPNSNDLVKLTPYLETYADVDPLIEAGFEPLLVFSRGWDAQAQGDREEAEEKFAQLRQEHGEYLQIGEVQFEIPKPLEPGEYTLECLGVLRNKGEETQYFLNAITLEARVELVSRFEGHSGAIWKIDFDEAERIYRLECQGHLKGPRFLNGIPFEKQVNLFPNAENEHGGTKWEVESVSNEPASTFRFKCRSSQEGAYYLDGRTLDSTVGLSDVSNPNFSGTRWKVEPVPDNPPPVPPTELDYTELEDMLRSNNWEEADEITGKIIWKQAGKLRDRSFKAEVSRKFPCEVLRTIDELWTKYSDGRFGFSVQRKIWQSSEVIAIPQVNGDIFKFMIRVGWGNWGQDEDGNRIFYFLPANFSDNALKEGQLPWLVTWEGSDGIRDRKAYLSKIVRCGI